MTSGGPTVLGRAVSKIYIENMAIYLAAAIDHKNHTEDIFQELGRKLWPAECFNPKGAFINANHTPQPWPKEDEFVATMNFTAIQQADAVVAYVEPGVMSFGVPMELMYATAIGKPVILVTKDFEPGIYARLFCNEVISYDQLCLGGVTETIERVSKFGSTEGMDALYKRNWIRNLLKLKGE